MTKRTKGSSENSGKNSGRGSISRGRPENLKPWKPGESGNPGGRPKGTPLTTACREVLAEMVPNDRKGRTYARAIAERLRAQAMKGSLGAIRELFDRTEGKPRQSIEIEDTTLREAFERMTKDELEHYARNGKLPPWFAGGDHETIE